MLSIDFKKITLADLWPHILTVPLYMCAFGLSVFFNGTDSILYAPAYCCLMGFLALLLFPNLRDGRWALPVNVVTVLSGLFGIYIIISLFFSSVPYVSTIFTLILTMLPVLFLALVVSRDAERNVQVMAGAFAAVIFGFAVWAIIQFLFMFDPADPRINDPMLNPNNLAGLFNLALIPSLAMFFLARTKFQNVLFLIVFAVFYCAILVTVSRGGILSFYIATLIIVPFIVIGKPFRLTCVKQSLALAVLVLCVPVLGSVHSVEGDIGHVMATAPVPRVDSASTTDRLLLWESTWNLAKDHIWLGVGLGTFYFYYPAYRDLKDQSDGFFAHMDPLQFWAEMGILAPVLFYGVLIAILVRTFFAVRSKNGTYENRLKIMGSFCGMLALTLHTHISFHLYMPALLIPLAVLLAFWYTETAKVIGHGKVREIILKPWPKRAVICAFVVLALLTSGWAVRWAGAIHYIREAQNVIREGGTKEDRTRLIKLAGKIAPPNYGKYYEYEARFALGEIWGRETGFTRDELFETYEFIKKNLDEAEKRNPAYTMIWDLRARLYYTVNGVILEDGTEQAVALLEKVIEKNPLSVDSRVGLSNIYRQRGEFEKAWKVLEDGLPWPRPKGQPDVNFMMAAANMRKVLGDQDGYQRLMTEALTRAQRYGLTVQRQP